MFIVVRLIKSPGLAIVAEANLRCGDFLSEKVVVTVLAVFSFWSWLPDIPWVFINLKTALPFLGLIMLCLLVNGTWECLVLDFSFFCGIMSFYVSISDAVFLVTTFSIFDQSVWLILSFWCAHFYSFIQFYWGSGCCTSEIALECFCLNKVITNW